MVDAVDLVISANVVKIGEIWGIIRGKHKDIFAAHTITHDLSMHFRYVKEVANQALNTKSATVEEFLAEAWLSDSYRKSEYQLLPQEIMLQRIKQERR